MGVVLWVIMASLVSSCIGVYGRTDGTKRISKFMSDPLLAFLVNRTLENKQLAVTMSTFMKVNTNV
jgi:hypothetical protein